MRFLILLLLISLGANGQYTNITGNYDYKNNINVGKALTLPKGLGSTNSPAKYDTGQIRYNIADSTVYVNTGSQWIKSFKTPPTPSWEQTLLANPNLTQGWNINLSNNDFEWDDATFYGIYGERLALVASDSGVLQGKWRIDSPMNYLKNVNGSLKDLSLVPKKYVDSVVAASPNGTVTSVSVVNANGFNGSVANPTTTPAITISTTVNGMVKGNSTAISAATPDVDYATPAYVDAKVEDQIVNGVTTKAPSQNAVYDALALKLNISDTAAMLDPYLKEADLPVYTASNGLTKSVNDFQLGGALTKNTNISATNYELNINDTSEFGTHRFTMQTNGNAMLIGKVSNNDSTMLRMSTEDNETMMIAYYNGDVNRLFANSAEATMEALNSDLKGVSLHLQTTGANFVDTRNIKKGIEYDGDYSSGYSNRSLVDKGYVTGIANTKLNISDTAAMLSSYVLKNASITGATKTKITYDSKGLVTAGANATTDDIAEGGNIGSPVYFTDERAQDAIGSMVDATLVYNDGIPSLGRAAISGDITIASGSNTAAITGNVIIDADVNTNAAINVTKLADGLVDNTEFNYLNGVTSGIQTQIGNKVTKGGDAGAFSIGTTDNNDLTVKLNNTDRWTFDGANGYLRRGSGSPYFGLQFYGTGAGSTITMGDVFDATTPYVSAREKGGTDTDQWEFFAQKGIYFNTGTFGGTAKLNIQQDGDIIYGGETQVTGAEHTFIGDADVSGNVNVQGNLTAGNILRATATLNFASTASTAVTTLTINVPGADVGDPVFLGVPNGSVTTTGTFWAWVSSANTVSVRFSPKATEDPASGDFTVVVFD